MEVFENTVDRGSAVIFDADSGFGACLMFGFWVLNWSGPKRYLDHRLFFSFGWYVNEFERSSVKLRCETVNGIVLCYSHRACCLLYVWE